MTKILLGCLLLFCTFQELQAQDLTDERDFFIKQEVLYQRWLNRSGLGHLLRVNSVDVKSDQLSLFLEFPFSHTDSVTNAWNQLKQDFEAENPGTLEQELFYKMLHIMDVRQSLCNVQLFDTYNLRREPCFFRGIYFKDGAVQVESTGCKADIQDIEFSASDLSSVKKSAIRKLNWSVSNTPINQLKTDFPAQRILELIYQYAENKLVKNYNFTNCKGRRPTIRQQELSRNTLRFSVEDLCLEVLADNSWLCGWLKDSFGYDCNWAKREKLEFVFFYEETADGFKISGKIDGYFANGFFDTISRDAYINMEEDERFKKDLEEYADEFSNELRQYLRKLIQEH